MQFEDTVAIIIGAASAVGRAVGLELARRKVHGLALVDHRPSVDQVARTINQSAGDWIGVDFHGDPMDAEFRKRVFKESSERCGKVNLCVPISAIPRRITSPQRLEAALICPVLWAHEMIDGIAENRCRNNCKAWHSSEPMQGMVVLITPESIFSDRAHKTCAAAKSKVKSATESLKADADEHGVRCAAVLSNSSHAQEGSAGTLFEDMVPSIHVQQQTSPQAIAEAICCLCERSFS